MNSKTCRADNCTSPQVASFLCGFQLKRSATIHLRPHSTAFGQSHRGHGQFQDKLLCSLVPRASLILRNGFLLARCRLSQLACFCVANSRLDRLRPVTNVPCQPALHFLSTAVRKERHSMMLANFRSPLHVLCNPSLTTGAAWLARPEWREHRY